MKYLSAFLLFALGFTGVLVTAPAPIINTGAALPQAAAVFETSLQSAITSSATSMTLTANSVRGGGSLSGYNCFTIDEGSAQAEYVCGTVSSTAVTSMTRGISPLTGTTTVAALQFAHRRGANVKITDFPLVQILKAQNNGEETFPNILSYTYSPNYTSAASSTIASKGYVDGVIVAGGVDADESTKGISELATATELGAGTSLGGTGGRLTIPNSLATSTPTASCSAFCVVVATAGKIAQAFIDLTANFTWTGAHTFNATTTIAASDTISSPLILNGISYKFPSTQGSSSTVLMTNGSGRLLWGGVANKLYNATSSVSGNSGTITVFSTTVPANTLSTSNIIKCEVPVSSLTTDLNNSTASFIFSYGSGNASSTITSQSSQTISTAKGMVTLILSGAGTTGSQRISINGNFNESTINDFDGVAIGASADIAIDSTQDQTLKFEVIDNAAISAFTADQTICQIYR